MEKKNLNKLIWLKNQNSLLVKHPNVTSSPGSVIQPSVVRFAVKLQMLWAGKVYFKIILVSSWNSDIHQNKQGQLRNNHTANI